MTNTLIQYGSGGNNIPWDEFIDQAISTMSNTKFKDPAKEADTPVTITKAMVQGIIDELLAGLPHVKIAMSWGVPEWLVKDIEKQMFKKKTEVNAK